MRHFPSGKQIPGCHCDEANDIYLRIKWLHQKGINFSKDINVFHFEPGIIDLNKWEMPLLEGLEVQGPVYATLCDAFIANAEFFLSPAKIFRGHYNCEWRLHPTLFRFNTSFARNFYTKCRNNFVNKAIEYTGERCPNISFDALCQHYGIPTDLLDVTECFEVAAYFAMNRETDKIGCIWIFDRQALIDANCFVHYSDIPYARDHNLRIIRQQGCFIRLASLAIKSTIIKNAKVILFNQNMEHHQVLRIKEHEVRRELLFPPDDDDGLLKQCGSILKEKLEKDTLIRLLEECNYESGKIICKGMQKTLNSLLQDANKHKVKEWLKQHGNTREDDKFTIYEYLTWYGSMDFIFEFLKSCSRTKSMAKEIEDLEFYAGPWYELIVYSVLEKHTRLSDLSANEREHFGH